MNQRRQRLWQGLRFDVEQVEVSTSDGRTVVRQVVVHPGAVVVLAVDAAGRIVLIRNHRYAVGRTLWELPAGTLEPGEPPQACAARELEEETGYRAGRLEKLCSFYTSPGICTEQMHAYLAGDLEPVGQRLEETESIQVEPRSLPDVQRLMRTNRIQDGKTLAVLGYYLLFRQKKA